MFDDLLPGALSFAHRLQAAIPMEKLEDGHQLLKLEHCLSLVRLEHEPKCGDPGARVVLLVCALVKPIVQGKSLSFYYCFTAYGGSRASPTP